MFGYSGLSGTQRATLNRNKQIVMTTFWTIVSRPTALFGFAVLVFFILLAILAPVLAPYDPHAHHLADDGIPRALESPSGEHPFGTTHDGRDVLSQWMHGTRVSLSVGLVSGFIVGTVGTTVGLIAGYYKGTIDLIVMRVVDILYGIPAVPLIIILALFWGPGIVNIYVAYTLLLWRTMSRIVRSEVLSVSARPFVKSARAAGASDIRIMTFHILPLVLPVVLIETTMTVGSAIILESGISFLGLGAVDQVSWGTMLELTFSSGAIRDAWWWVLPPGLSITIVVISFFYVSRALEDVINPESGGGFGA